MQCVQSWWKQRIGAHYPHTIKTQYARHSFILGWLRAGWAYSNSDSSDYLPRIHLLWKWWCAPQKSTTSNNTTKHNTLIQHCAFFIKQRLICSHGSFATSLYMYIWWLWYDERKEKNVSRKNFCNSSAAQLRHHHITHEHRHRDNDPYSHEYIYIYL